MKHIFVKMTALSVLVAMLAAPISAFAAVSQTEGKWNISFVNAEGKAQTGWVYSAGKWYYLDPVSGQMATGWQEIGNTWYYFHPERSAAGEMLSGWRWIDGYRYFLGNPGSESEGRLVVAGVTPDGRRVNELGQWTDDQGRARYDLSKTLESTDAQIRAFSFDPNRARNISYGTVSLPRTENVPAEPNTGSENPTPSVPEGGSETPAPSGPEMGNETPNPSVPDAGSQTPNPSTPEGGSENQTPSVPEAGNETPASSVPETGNETPAPSVPETGNETPAPSVPGTGSENQTPSIPEGGSETPSPSAPDAGSQTPNPSTPEGGSENQTPSVPEGGSETPSPSIPETGNETPAPNVPDTGSQTPNPSVPDAGSENQTPSVPDLEEMDLHIVKVSYNPGGNFNPYPNYKMELSGTEFSILRTAYQNNKIKFFVDQTELDRAGHTSYRMERNQFYISTYGSGQTIEFTPEFTPGQSHEIKIQVEGREELSYTYRLADFRNVTLDEAHSIPDEDAFVFRFNGSTDEIDEYLARLRKIKIGNAEISASSNTGYQYGFAILSENNGKKLVKIVLSKLSYGDNSMELIAEDVTENLTMQFQRADEDSEITIEEVRKVDGTDNKYEAVLSGSAQELSWLRNGGSYHSESGSGYKTTLHVNDTAYIKKIWGDPLIPGKFEIRTGGSGKNIVEFAADLTPGEHTIRLKTLGRIAISKTFTIAPTAPPTEAEVPVTAVRIMSKPYSSNGVYTIRLAGSSVGVVTDYLGERHSNQTTKIVELTVNGDAYTFLPGGAFSNGLRFQNHRFSLANMNLDGSAPSIVLNPASIRRNGENIIKIKFADGKVLTYVGTVQ